jgi:hypothetical protein
MRLAEYHFLIILNKTWGLALCMVVALFAPGSFVQAQSNVDHWETVVYDSSTWRYIVPNTDLGSSWIQPGYDDSNWLEAKGGFGYGDNDDSTVIGTTLAVFMRKTFQITDLSSLEVAMLNIDFDDGYIAYLNGVELGRANLSNYQFPQFDQPATGLHEALLYRGLEPDGLFIDNAWLVSLLVEGNNTLAIQVHNRSLNSSDLSARSFFSVGVNNTSSIYGTPPAWFTGPLVFESSDLPIVKINTNLQTILDDIRIVVDMGIIDNGPGIRNQISDPFNNYDGKISIELRGESSSMFPKKSYSLETQTDLGDNNNVSLLGMPIENDWILYAPYSDKSLIRNVLSFQLSRQIGRYASRTRYCELVLNGEYLGIYVLMEKIKRDANRVDIAKLTPNDISGDELTGGYILRVDKIDANDYPAWTSVPVPQLANERSISFQYYDPKGDELLPEQQEYIKKFIFDYESVLSSSGYDDLDFGYGKFIGEKSFVDFMMINEVAKNIDGYIFSTYMFKEKDSNGGKLKMGPLWDFNLAFGNVDYQTNAQFAPGWMYNDDYRMYWFRRLMSDPNFANRFQCRWDELRADILSDQKITTTIDSLALVLNEAQVRNFKKWKILGNYVWPNQFVGNTFQEEIDFIKQWALDRLAWMDANLTEPCGPIITGIVDESVIEVGAYPNPSTGSFHITGLPAGKSLSIMIFDQTGRLVKTGYNVQGTDYEWQGDNNRGAMVSSGVYILKIIGETHILAVVKLIKSR